MCRHSRRGNEVVASAEYDEDEETWTLTALAEPGAEDEDDDDDSDDDDDAAETEAFKGATFEVTKVSEKDEVVELSNDDGKFKMWVGDGLEVDYDVVKKGVTVKVDAEQDDESDWILTKISVAKEKSAGKSSGKKGGKKK
jgi:hypothetical protein